MDRLSALELSDLLRQVTAKPRFSPGDIAVIESRLSRFDAIVVAAYREIEELPEGPKLRKLKKRELVRLRREFRNTIRFCVHYGLPVEYEIDHLNQVEQEILDAFPDAEPALTAH